MKALKKILLGVLSVACVMAASVGLTACDILNEKSAYEIWLENGHSGTKEDFLEWLKGEDETTEEQEGTDGLEYYPVPDGYAVDQGDAMYLEEIIIPSTYKGKAVTALADNAFSEAKVKSITIPDSVTSIGDSAFENCSSLTSIEIPDSVTSIDYQAFSSCSSLTSVVIGDSVTSIGKYAFENCSNLTSVVIGDSVTSIGRSTFSGCSSLTSVVISDSVTSIGEYAFSSCSSLTSVVIGDSVTSIGDFAFENCSSLTSVVIGDSVTSIGCGAFANCSSLTRVYYKGGASDWNNVYIYSLGNNYLTNATKYYYSESQPTEEGNYWHYDENGEVAVW